MKQQGFAIIQNSNIPHVLMFTIAMFFTENGYHKTLIRSVHFLRKNSLSKSGVVLTNKFVQTKN